MTSPPADPSAGGPHQQSQRPPPKSGQRENATTGRRELASRHARFAEVSPEVGVLDERAARQALGEDPAAFELLAVLVAVLTLLSIAFYLAEWIRHMNSFGAGH